MCSEPEEVGESLGKYRFSLDNDEGVSEVNKIKNARNNKWLPLEMYYVYEDYFNENVLSIGIANAKADEDFYFFFQIFDKDVQGVGLKNIKEELLKNLTTLSLKTSSGATNLYKYCDTDFQYENKNFYKLQDGSKRKEVIKKIKDGLLEIAVHIDENRSEIGEILKGI